jgi:hypothetical protein
MCTASLRAPASCARANRIVFAASGRPFFVPPLFANQPALPRHDRVRRDVADLH